MKKNRKAVVPEAVCVSIFGLLVTLLLGYLLTGSNTFSPDHAGFQFVWFGLSGSILFPTLKDSGSRNFLFVFVLLFMAEIVRTQTTHVPTVAGRFLFFLCLGGSIYLYAQLYIKRLADFVVGKFVALAGLLALSKLIIISFFNIFDNIPHFKGLLAGQVLYGVLIGGGLGLGFEIGLLLYPRLLKRSRQNVSDA